MSIKITCLQCGKSHKVNDRLAGKRVRCPECDTAVHVPELPIPAKPVAVEPAVVEPLEVESVAAEPVAVEAVPVSADPVSVEAVVAEPGDASNDNDNAAGVVAAVAVGAASDAGVVPANQGPDQGAAQDSAMATAQSDDGGGPSPPTPIDDDDDIAPRKERDLGELDMTPMVDVTFLLLIFFVVTASFQLQKSIMMPRQQTDAPSTNSVEEQPDELDQVELQIDEFGAFTVLAADWEAETPGKQNLISKLKEAQTEAGAKLIIKVHEQCLLQALVDGMDAGTIADYKEIEVTQVDEFD